MNDAVDIGVLSKDLVQCGLIGHVSLIEGWLLAADQLDAVQNLLGRIVQVVNNDDLIIGLQQRKGRERANVARSTARLLVDCSSWRGMVGQRGDPVFIYPVTRTEPTTIVNECVVRVSTEMS